MRPITRAGQHQAPISAGMLIIMVRTLRRSDLRSSDRCSTVLGSRSLSIGSWRVPTSLATAAVADWLSRGGRRVQTSPTQSISAGGAIGALLEWAETAGTGCPAVLATRNSREGMRERLQHNCSYTKKHTRAVGVCQVLPSRQRDVDVHTTLPCVSSEHSHHSPGRIGARRPLHLLPSAALGGSRCAAGAGAAGSPAHPCYGRQCVGCRTGSQSRSS